jgi:hypothetical protein
MLASTVWAPAAAPAGSDSTASARQDGSKDPEATSVPSMANVAVNPQVGVTAYCASNVDPARPCAGINVRLPA